MASLETPGAAPQFISATLSFNGHKVTLPNSLVYDEADAIAAALSDELNTDVSLYYGLKVSLHIRAESPAWKIASGGPFATGGLCADAPKPPTDADLAKECRESWGRYVETAAELENRGYSVGADSEYVTSESSRKHVGRTTVAITKTETVTL